ncbi:DNA mismatch repair protein Mlh3p [Trichomonascus vanleenenianus]|uniref:mismatch repair protein MLH3 n=1 Tax=Trichomonascus vanleenenianus TaxID=2268995 RepID=UPI003ECA2A1B
METTHTGEASGIARIQPVVAQVVKSQVVISSFSQCIAELVINSIEAGADVISVDLGLPELSCTVADNGFGMTSEDLRFVGLPYYSSKAGSETVTHKPHQGHTISSIGAIAMVSISSSTNATVYATRIHSSKRIDPYKLPSSSRSRGTTIKVKALFATMPVRRRFESSLPLKAQLTTLKQLLLPYFLNRNFELTVRSDDTIYIHHPLLSTDHGLMTRIKATIDTMSGVVVDYNSSSVIPFIEDGVAGVITLAESGSKNSTRYLLVNNIIHEGLTIYRQIESLLEQCGFASKKKRAIWGEFVRRYPVYIICVNQIHEKNLESVVLNSLTNALVNNSFKPPSSTKPNKPITPRVRPVELNSKYFNPPKALAENAANVKSSSLQDCRVISQIASKFVLVNLRNEYNETYLSVIDQHAADERIRCEKTFTQFIESGRNPIPLDPPITLQAPHDLSPTELQPYMFQWGVRYTVESSCVHVTHLPDIICDCGDERLISSVILGHLRDIHDGAKGKLLLDSESNWTWEAALNACPKALVEVINSLSCRNAIKFGDKLSHSECQNLIRQLSYCKYPFQCAHGRPSLAPLVNLSAIP